MSKSARLNAQAASRGELVSPQNGALTNSADPAIREFAVPSPDGAHTAGGYGSVTIVSAFRARNGSVRTNGLDDSSLCKAVSLPECPGAVSPTDREVRLEFEVPRVAVSLGWTAVTVALDPASRSGATHEESGAARRAILTATRTSHTFVGDRGRTSRRCHLQLYAPE